MPSKAVFLDRDHTLMEEPGLSSDPSAVKLLPGVELALKSLAQAGFKLVVVTNQPGIARGLLTEEALSSVHAELRRQLKEKSAHLDAIYYCPYHPEGTVDRYARESDDRKPKPGMLLRAGADLDIDLHASWMVGDGPSDVEAGQRAGCRTVRVRGGQETWHGGEGEAADEDVQADYTVRNLVDAARLILRERNVPRKAPPAPNGVPAGPPAAAAPFAAAPPPPPAAQPWPPAPAADAVEGQAVGAMSDSEVLHELLRHARQLARLHHRTEFSVTKLVGGLLQAVAVVLFVVFVVIGFAGLGAPSLSDPKFLNLLAWIGVVFILQVMALTFFVMSRQE